MIRKHQVEVKQSAFTVIELVIVTAILAIVASIAVPRYASLLATQRVEAAARRIVADLSFAQRQARFTSASQAVTFNLALHEYSGSTTLVQLWEEPYGATIVSVDFGGDAEIEFDGFGVPDSGGSVVVQVGKRQKTVNVDADSGKAAVQ